jgi:hypothetical protein
MTTTRIPVRRGWVAMLVINGGKSARGVCLALFTVPAGFQTVIPSAVSAQDSPSSVRQADTEENHGKLLATRAVERLALGDAFDAKLRQRIWTGGREVVGIGYYEQSGGGTARYSLEMTIHDGDLRHHSRQISDGKLAWVRSQLANEITLRRVDLGRIDEFYREVVRQGLAKDSRSLGITQPVGLRRGGNDHPVPPWMRVGGLVELIDQIATDYDLRVSKGKVDDEPVWILRGEITDAAKDRVLTEAEGSTWSPLSPFEVRVAIAATGDDSGFGVGLPKRIEFWGQPPKYPEGSAATEGGSETMPDGQPIESQEASPPTTASDTPRGRLISLLEIYAVRRIEPSPEERFRFEREERDVSFSNDTRRYLQRIAVRSIAGTRRSVENGP